MKKLGLLLLFIFFFNYTTYSQTAEEYLNSGIAKSENGKYYAAIVDYNKGIKLLNNSDNSLFSKEEKLSLLYNNRAWSKYKLKDNKGACIDWKRAASMRNIKAQNALRYLCN